MFIFEAPVETAHSDDDGSFRADGEKKKGEERACKLNSLVLILVHLLQTPKSLHSSTSIRYVLRIMYARTNTLVQTHTSSCFIPHRLVASLPIPAPHFTELFTLGFSAGPLFPRQQDLVDVFAVV